MDTLQAYQVLGLDPGASDAQLKAAWRRLVAAWHPDRNAAQDAGSRMQGINKAYQHLRQLRQDEGETEDDAEDDADDDAEEVEDDADDDADEADDDADDAEDEAEDDEYED
jgi:DnaJ-class molecular chaperone